VVEDAEAVAEVLVGQKLLDGVQCGGQEESGVQALTSRRSRGEAPLGHRRTIAASSVALPAGLAAATDSDGQDEAYPPQATTTVVTPVTRPLPPTGASGADNWLKVGAGAILVGGVLVAATARRRHATAAVTR